MTQSEDKQQLTKTIQLVHSKSGHYKTTLFINPLFYQVVTRVSYLTALLWIEYINPIIKQYNTLNPDKKIELFTKPNWLVMIKSYRRDFVSKINGKLP